MKPPQSGEFNQLVTLRARAAGVDALGQPSKNWTDIAKDWAIVEPLTGREFFSAGQQQSSLVVRIRMRYRAGVLPSMRVQWGSVSFDIVSVADVAGEGHTLELMCSTSELP